MKYIIKRIGRSVEISEATSSLLVYRIPYQNLSVGADEPIKIKNKFIVYILFGENNDGQDVIYVGKSTNGLKNRPTSHDDKYFRVGEVRADGRIGRYLTLDLKDPSIPGTFQGAARRAENFRLTHFRMTYKKGTV